MLDAEVDRILAIGVELELNRKVTNIEEAMTEGGFDAAFLAVGAHIGKHADIPAGEAARILDAVSMLESMESDEKPLLGRKVVVYGGGNTAMDAARTAKRLGATDAVVVYRRNRDRMPAHEFEVAEAEEEGVMMRWLETIKQVDGHKITVEKMELDETGFPQPTGELDELEADSVILALGQEADLSLLDDVSGIEVEDGVVQVGPNMMTGHEGVFAGGDMVPAERTVTVGVGHGKKAARNIDGWLRSQAYEPGPSTRSSPSTSSTPGTTPTHPSHCSPSSRSRGGAPPSTRWWAGWTSRMPCTRPAAACRAATASAATTASASAPTTRS